MTVFYHPGGELKSSRDSLFNYPAGWYYRAKGYYWADADAPVHVLGSNHGNPFKTEKAARIGYELNQHHAYWYKIWHKAWDNMPTRVRREKVWVSREPGTTPLADFIKGSAKGKMKIIDNLVYEIILSDPIHYGQQSALAVLMGYPLRKGGHNQVYVSSRRGSRPKDEQKRELLLALAGDDGKEIALNLLITKHGRAKYYVAK